MAFNASTDWEVRTTGDDANGGGFNTASTGTDYSQQDAAQVVYTDLAIQAANTQLKSALNPFTAAHVGNIINVTGGTGFTVQRVQINSVAAGVATCDKACGTANSTGGTGNLGGALATIQKAGDLIASNNLIHVKAGTYTLTTPTYIQLLGRYRIVGYQTTHGDGGTRPVITTATDSTSLLQFRNNNITVLENLSFTTTATVKARGVEAYNATSGRLAVIDCDFDGFTYGIGEVTGNYFVNTYLMRSEIRNCTNTGFLTSTGATVVDCYVHHNTNYGVYVGSGSATILNSIIAYNGKGIRQYGSAIDLVTIQGCTIAHNTTDGVYMANNASSETSMLQAVNNIIYGNGAYGVNRDSVTRFGNFLYNNALGANTTANYRNSPAGGGGVALSADPFTDAASGDYSLNDTAGGGAACKAAGYPGAFPGGTTTGYLDIGAAQSQAVSYSLPDAKYIYKDIDRGDGALGLLNASNISDAAGAGSDLAAGDLKSGVTVDDVTGTLVGGGDESYGWTA